jgi:hypothetical protein
MALLASPAAAPAGTLDQQQLNAGGGDTYIDSGSSLSQTFTAGLTGKLDQVDLFLRVLNAPTPHMTVEIRNVTAGSPGSTVLASQMVTPSGITGAFTFVPITFAVPASVASGTQYAIVTYSATSPPTHYSWARSIEGNVYTGGTGFFVSISPPSGTWLEGGGAGFDYAFQTYVGPSPTDVGPSPTGQRAAALEKCKKKAKKKDWTKKKLRKCKKKAKLLPV